MKLTDLSSLWRLVLILLPFILIQRWFHRELQIVLMLLTRRVQVVVIAISVLFFPGLLLHEGSHFLVAKLLGVRTGRFSLVPQIQSGGKIRMGFVETERVDFIRNSLIGLAPLLTGCLLIALLGMKLLSLDTLSQFLFIGNWQAFWTRLNGQLSQPLFWVGLYFSVTISSMMLPSESDRRDWVPLVIFLLALFLVVYFAGAWDAIQPYFVTWLDRILSAAGMVFAFSLAVLFAAVIPLWLLHQILGRLMRVKTGW